MRLTGSTTTRKHVVRLVFAGAALVVASGGGLLATATSSASAPAPRPAPMPQEATAASGAGDVTVDRITYQPGQHSGWHAHAGVHAVDVLSGTLTVVDEHCQSHTYAAGDRYIGGRHAHLARNDTGSVVEMAVTYRIAAGTSLAEFTVPATAPIACPGH